MAAMLGVRAFSLAADRAGGGVYCGADGVFVGGIALLKRSGAPATWSVRTIAELNSELSAGYRLPVDITSKANALALIAHALNRGDIAMAAIATVQMQLPDLPPLVKGMETDEEIARRAAELGRSGLLKSWDPARHPRTGTPPNRAWFAPVGRQTEAAAVGDVKDAGTAAKPERLSFAQNEREAGADAQSATDAPPPSFLYNLTHRLTPPFSPELDRHLTAGEVALLQSVYGPDIDTRSVLVRSRSYSSCSHNPTASS